LTLRRLERERLRWSDAAGAVGLRRCTSEKRLTAALDALRKPLYEHGLGEALTDYNGPIRRAYAAGELSTARAQDRRLDGAWWALNELRSRLRGLEPRGSAARAGRTWVARLETVEDALSDLQDSMRRRGSQATVDRRYGLLRRAIRAEFQARRQLLSGLDISGAEPVLPPETSES
jgi:hypothetical protein